MSLGLATCPVRVLYQGRLAILADATLSVSRGKKTVAVRFPVPILIAEGVLSKSEEFYLEEFDCARMIWGQGMTSPDSNWKLHPGDAARIVASGGG